MELIRYVTDVNSMKADEFLHAIRFRRNRAIRIKGLCNFLHETLTGLIILQDLLNLRGCATIHVGAPPLLPFFFRSPSALPGHGDIRRFQNFRPVICMGTSVGLFEPLLLLQNQCFPLHTSSGMTLQRNRRLTLLSSNRL
jgi:hypothetical protein